MDNTAGENKNQWLLGFCGLLVLCRWFKKVILTFLVVGHTGFECDSSNRPLKDAWREVDLLTLFDLLYEARRAAPSADLVYLESVMDWRSFLSPYLPGVKGIHAHW